MTNYDLNVYKNAKMQKNNNKYKNLWQGSVLETGHH